MTTKDTVTMGVHAGGRASDEATQPFIVPLKKLLKRYCRGPYSPDIDEFSFVLRIDGDISQFDFEGCEKLRLSKKGRYITVDIGVTMRIWRDSPPEAIRAYLAKTVLEGLTLMVNKIKKEKIEIASDEIVRDFQKALDEFLKTVPRPRPTGNN